MVNAVDIINHLKTFANKQQREVQMRFFKTNKGEYGEGDQFLGIKVPQTRTIVKQYRHNIALCEIEKLLYSSWHEVRLCGLLLLVEDMKLARPRKRDIYSRDKSIRRKKIVDFYIKNSHQANNWDLVDLSCPYILGEYLLHNDTNDELPSSNILDMFALNNNLWHQRIAIVSTLILIRNGRFDETIRISKQLLTHNHDLIHKAIGWMLREVGKRDINLLRKFLQENCHVMSRTTLRYSIERMNEVERHYWLNY